MRLGVNAISSYATQDQLDARPRANDVVSAIGRLQDFRKQVLRSACAVRAAVVQVVASKHIVAAGGPKDLHSIVAGAASDDVVVPDRVAAYRIPRHGDCDVVTTTGGGIGVLCGECGQSPGTVKVHAGVVTGYGALYRYAIATDRNHVNGVGPIATDNHFVAVD